MRLGSGDATRAGCAAKASRLDEAAVAGLPVPDGCVVADGVDEPAVSFDRPLAVRSAFAAEDTETSSLAGHFDSLLHVDPAPTSVRAAIAAVRASGDASFRRDVLVMEMVDALVAGVAFTEPGWAHDLVNHTSGVSDALLAGEEEGARLRLDRAGRFTRGTTWQRRLAVLLRDVRAAFGDNPWDIEWADDGHRCWLLQIRPITAPPVRDEQFTLANHREILPDPPSFLMTSLIVESAPRLAGPLGILSGSAGGRNFIEVFDDRPYLNLSLITDTVRSLGLPTSIVSDSLGGDDADGAPLDPERFVASLPTLVGLGFRQLFAARRARQVAASFSAPPSRREPNTFAEVLSEAGDSYVALVDQMGSLAVAMALPVSLLGRTGALAAHLRHQRSAGTRILDDLGALQRLVADDPHLAAALQDGHAPDDDRFTREWERWLDLHGHRGRFESDLSMPRYLEQPGPIFDAILQLPLHDGGVPKRSLREWLTLPLWLLASAPMREREAIRAAAMRAFDRHRRDLLRIAATTLPTPESVWMLTADELREVDAGRVIDSALIDQRRQRREHAVAQDVPSLRTRFGGAVDEVDPATGVAGLPLTAGRVEGDAWVLTTPSTEVPAELRGGPIVLVARSVDAGWLPTFPLVDAVVVEIGGDLSHGSIILRELGIPAMTNARRATSAISTGDRCRVDTGAGRLEVLDPRSDRAGLEIHDTATVRHRSHPIE